MTRDDMRAQQIADWLRTLNFPLARLEPASNDASFRRYFRAWRADGATRVVMDAPPENESIAPFVKVARLLQRCGVHVPEIDALDQAHGFVLMEDLGSVHYLERLRAGEDADALYADALAALRRIQVQGAALAQELPPSTRDSWRAAGAMSISPVSFAICGERRVWTLPHPWVSRCCGRASPSGSRPRGA